MLLLPSCKYFNQFIYNIRYLAENFLTDSDIQLLIDTIILERFDSFINPTKIYFSLNEYKDQISTIDKINDISFYLKITNNQAIEDLIIERFKSINLKNMFYTDERKYLQFYKEYEKKLSIIFINLIHQVFENMSWFGSMDNLQLLEEINKNEIEEYIQNNREFTQSKISNTIKREIEFLDTDDSLDYFKDRIDSNENTLKRFTISISDFDSDFKIKRTEIAQKETEKENKVPEIKPIEIIESEIENFDVDQIFKLEMFENENN